MSETTDDCLIEIASKTPTLRDQFAMTALQGVIIAAGASENSSNYAEAAYRYADAMMEAREK